MATRSKDAAQPYGLTNEVVAAMLNGVSSYEAVFGEGGIYRTLTKRLFERMLETELTHHLGYETHQKPPEELRH
jgi:transposase-like protein